MAITNKGSKWERRSSYFLIFAFLPILNCIPFFHMNSRIKNKRWLFLGWFVMILDIVLILAVALIPTAGYSLEPERPYYSEVAGSVPDVEDFMTMEQREKYLDDYSYSYSKEFKLSEENEKYENAVNQYYTDEKEWEKQPEIAAQISDYENFNSIIDGLSIGSIVALGIFYFIVIVLAFSERPKYLKLLADSENHNQIRETLTRERSRSLETQNIPVSSVNPVSETLVDINSADEETLTSLKGINLIDAKKIIEYRENNKGFSTKDEFFDCISAKPHIIVAIENQIEVGEYKSAMINHSTEMGKRKLDL